MVHLEFFYHPFCYDPSQSVDLHLCCGWQLLTSSVGESPTVLWMSPSKLHLEPSRRELGLVEPLVKLFRLAFLDDLAKSLQDDVHTQLGARGFYRGSWGLNPQERGEVGSVASKQQDGGVLDYLCGVDSLLDMVTAMSIQIFVHSERAAAPLLQFLLPSLFLFLFSILLIFHRWRQNHRRLPPSPPSFPILGHLHLLNPPIHRPHAAISTAHGPVVLLRFGSRPALLVSSPSAVVQCFTVHDVAFVNRPRFLAGKILEYDFTAILWAPYGSHWRDLRHITSMHSLASDNLRASFDLRSGEIRALAWNFFLQQSGGNGGAPRRLDLKSTLFDRVCAIIEQLVVPLTGETQEQRLIVREMVSEGLQLSVATANAGDDMPEFMRVAWRGLEKRLMRLWRRRDESWGKLIMLHRERRQSEDNGNGSVNGEGRETLMDVILSLQNNDPERYTDDIIKGLMTVRNIFSRNRLLRRHNRVGNELVVKPSSRSGEGRHRARHDGRPRAAGLRRRPPQPHLLELHHPRDSAIVPHHPSPRAPRNFQRSHRHGIRCLRRHHAARQRVGYPQGRRPLGRAREVQVGEVHGGGGGGGIQVHAVWDGAAAVPRRGSVYPNGGADVGDVRPVLRVGESVAGVGGHDGGARTVHAQGDAIGGVVQATPEHGATPFAAVSLCTRGYVI
ncbi:hypothetical protein ZIOFF_074083 [Zingiber officinale]|uniref:Uncharacterized protein n=1 Tax=Zingiber officinale TaxID=94328 RepID=A0A8J5BXK4_ZINOF|nr:hypothetical protein ZIOFF_074083 [Zingiber officinale]